MQRSWWAVACGLGLCPKPGGEVGRGAAAFVAVPSLSLQSQSGTSPQTHSTRRLPLERRGLHPSPPPHRTLRSARLFVCRDSTSLRVRHCYSLWMAHALYTTSDDAAIPCSQLLRSPASPPRAPPPQIDGRVDAASHPLPPHTYTHALLLPTDRLSIMHCIPSPSAPCLSASALPLPSCPTTGASFSGWLRTALPCASS